MDLIFFLLNKDFMVKKIWRRYGKIIGKERIKEKRIF